MGGGEKKKKQLSGAQKRKKKKEKEEAMKEALAEMERLKLGPSELWTGLVLHHKDVFVSHVLSKLNTTDRYFFGMVNSESRGVLEYAGVNVSELGWLLFRMLIHFDVGMDVESLSLGKERYRGRCGRSSLVLRSSCWNEQTRVAQVGERSETLRVECNDDCCGST